ncbi:MULTISPECIES: hypothetical protein [Clostridia]|uniref:hypothetical protein n=1 Tax=Clostridia TaxID=186801 RepID=UPI000EA0A2C2|nr:MULTISPECIES: hypothetical protein [Clostridia]NBJ68069.1 hypothetical protein [Roseburia sp. 1XD42-34]RKI82510.1 hypothetical protein D7V87_01075 [Clostridium sp. 1xD42-85]
MNTYIHNYWSLYLDFLNDFKALTYQGISIPYLCSYHTLVHSKETMRNELYSKKFSDHLTSKITERKEIQDVFSQFLQEHKKPIINPKQGKVALIMDKLLRFPNVVLSQYFNSGNTVIINPGSNKVPHSRVISKAGKRKARAVTNTISIKKFTRSPSVKPTLMHKSTFINLADYKPEIQTSVAQLQGKAKKIVNTFKNHPLYSSALFQQKLLQQIEEVILRIEQSQRVLNDVNLSCIIVSSTQATVNRIFAVVASQKGIPSICMQHGIISSEFGYMPKIAEIDAVYGYFEKDWYVNLGAPTDSVEIIGHPRFDLKLSSSMTRESFAAKLGLDNRKKALLVIVRENYDIEKWKELVQTILKSNKLNVLVRDYPTKETNILLQEFPSLYSTKNFQLYDILTNVDAVVAYPSTVGLEAMLIDKPVFILNQKFAETDIITERSIVHMPDYSGYFDSLGEMVQQDPGKLGKLIIKYMSDSAAVHATKKKREEFLSYVYPQSKPSAERLKDLINRLTH